MNDFTEITAQLEDTNERLQVLIDKQSLPDQEQTERQLLLDQCLRDIAVVTKEFDQATTAQQTAAAEQLAPYKAAMDEEIKKIAEKMQAAVDRLVQRFSIKQKRVEKAFFADVDVIIARTKRDALIADIETAFKAADTALVEKYDALIAQEKTQ